MSAQIEGRSTLVMPRLSRVLMIAVTTIAATAATLVVAPAASADISTGLIAHYRLNELSGSTVADSSGNARTATVDGSATWNNGNGFTFSGGANGSGNAIILPNDLLSGLDDVSVDFDVRVEPSLTGNWFMFNLGNPANFPNGDGYMFVTGKDAGNRFRGTVADAGFGTEQSASRSGGLETGVWKHVTLTVDGGAPGSPGTSRLYEDGVLVATNSALTIKPSQLGNPDGSTTLNVLGRSAYGADASFKGAIRDFRLYDKALDQDDIRQLSAQTSTTATDSDKAALTLGDVSSVTADLSLPSRGENGSKIVWETSDASTVGVSGVVNRPSRGAGDAAVTLTATLTHGAISTTKTFAVTVREEDVDDASMVHTAVESIALVHPDDVRGNLTLPTRGRFGTSFAWTSTRPDVVSPTGEVKRPAHGSAPVEVTVTVTGTLRAASRTRDIVVTVEPSPAPLDYAAYAFSYFAGESDDDGEKIYFAASKGDDPLDYDELNDGKPVLSSTLGEKGLRDPFIIRSHEGDRFYLLATDLKIHGGNNFGRAQESGSKSLMIWESTDLVSWSAQREVKVSPDVAGNTWAPEAFYDEKSGEYVVYWASNLYDSPEQAGREVRTSYNRMMYATTRDFVTFTEAKPWIDVKRGPGLGMIDATIVKDGDTFYRVVKDEASMTPRQEKSTDLLAAVNESLPTTASTPGWKLVKEGVGVGQPNPWGGTFTNGEGPTIFRDNNDPDRWIMLIDQPGYHGGRGYLAFETKDIAAGNWTSVPAADLPSSPRHGTVLPVTQAELDRLRLNLQPDLLVTSVTPLEVSTKVGTAPVLPETAAVTSADGTTKQKPVDWDEVDRTQYAQTGSFEVAGDVQAGSTIRAVAKVTVADSVDPTVALATTPASPNGSGGWWTSRAVTVAATGSDDPQVVSVATSVDDGAWTTVTGDTAAIVVTGVGKHTVRARATDVGGNISTESSLGVNIDTVAPVSKATVDTAARTVDVRSADDGSGVASTEYRIGTSGDWLTVTGPVKVDDTTTTVQYRAVDVAGHLEKPNTVTVPSSGRLLLDSSTIASPSTEVVRVGSGLEMSVRVNGSGPIPTGTVRVMDGQTLVGTGTLAGGRASVPVRTNALTAAGSGRLLVRYDGDAGYRPSQDDVVVVVKRAVSTVSVKMTPAKITSRSRSKASISVATGTDVRPGGIVTVEVRAAGKRYAHRTARIGSDGRVVVRLPRLATRSYHVVVSYTGNATVESSHRTIRLRVGR